MEFFIVIFLIVGGVIGVFDNEKKYGLWVIVGISLLWIVPFGPWAIATLIELLVGYFFIYFFRKAKKRTIAIALLCVIALIAISFFFISGEGRTKRVPNDETHEIFHEIVRSNGKKATEEFCKDCHDTDGNPLSVGHPPPFRCLFCHKFEGS